MNHARALLSASAILTAAAAFAFAGDAGASGFGVARFGGEHGNVTESNPASLYYNPAGIADREPGKDNPFNVRVMADVNLALRGASYTHTQAPTDIDEPAGAEGANNGEASLFNVVAAPMIGATFKIKDFAIGTGFYIPLGGQSHWSPNEKFEGNEQYPGPVDGVQRWASIDGTLRSMYLSFGAAYDIAKYVSVGASANIIFSQIETVRARQITGNDDVAAEGRSLIDVKGTNGSFGAGILVEPLPGKLWIGASYQAQPGLGQMVLEGDLINFGPSFGTKESKAKVKLFQELPDVYRLGARLRPAEKWELRLFGEVIDWSKFENQCLIDAESDTCEVDPKTGGGKGDPSPLVNLERNWDTAFAVRAGASYWVKPSIEVFFGAGYDSNAVPDETLEPALTDFDDLSVALGGRFQLIDQLALMVSYTHFFYFARDTTGKNELAERQTPTTVPDAGGEYTQSIGAINVNFELMFGAAPAPLTPAAPLDAPPVDAGPPPAPAPPPPADAPPPPAEAAPPPPADPAAPPPADPTAAPPPP